MLYIKICEGTEIFIDVHQIQLDTATNEDLTTLELKLMQEMLKRKAKLKNSEPTTYQEHLNPTEYTGFTFISWPANKQPKQNFFDVIL